MQYTRRTFLTHASLAAGALLGPSAWPDTKVAAPKLCVFSKHLQFLDYTALAQTCKDLGLDGVDLTVRNRGHVLPENVAADLPIAVGAIRNAGLEVPMITTNLNDGNDPDARPILEAAGKLGIPYFRVGGQKYKSDGDLKEQLNGFAESVGRLAALAAEVGMTAGYHNHSGIDNVGGALWDLREMIEAVDSPHFGSNFDVGHTVVEGAYGAWKVNTRAIAPYAKMMAVKDFVWRDNRPAWVPIGDGVVPITDQLSILRNAGFSGPISIHCEYKVGGDEAMIQEIRNAVPVMRKVISDAGYTAR